MSTLSNSTYTNPALIAVPAVLAAIGLAYTPARPAIIAVAGVVALALLFKPLTVALLRNILLALAPSQKVAVAKKATVAATSPVQTAFALNRQANLIAQTQPALAAELRMRAAYAAPQRISKRVAVQAQAPAQTRFALNRKANQIAQTQPELAAKLRMQVAYA
jgi:hypothetical protein